PLYLAHTSQRSVSNHRRGPTIALHAIHSVADAFQASPSPRRLAATSRRIEFVILRTASSSPVAPHPASQRRSYLQLRGHGLPRHGLAPCCVHAFRGALGARPSGRREVGNPPYSPRLTTIRPEESLPRERSECPGCRAPTPIRSGHNQIETALVEFK